MMISSITGYGNLFIVHNEFNMHFELDKYKETLDQRFVNENLTTVNNGEQIKIFHASVWIEALLKKSIQRRCILRFYKTCYI